MHLPSIASKLNTLFNLILILFCNLYYINLRLLTEAFFSPNDTYWISGLKKHLEDAQNRKEQEEADYIQRMVSYSCCKKFKFL